MLHARAVPIKGKLTHKHKPILYFIISLAHYQIITLVYIFPLLQRLYHLLHIHLIAVIGRLGKGFLSIG